MKIENLEFYKELLKCNTSNYQNFDNEIIKEEFNLYEKASLNCDNYVPVNSLEQWKHGDIIYNYPVIHPAHEKIVEVIKTLNYKDICEVGAGAGIVAKYIYNLNNDVNLTCVESSDTHISQMKENFDKSIDIIKPNIDVRANIIKSLAQEIPLDDNSFDIVYTSTVLMHIPFILVPKVIMEITRISKKYILHVENTNNELNTVIIGNQKSDLNKLTLNYEKIYNKLNVKTVMCEYFKYPYVDCNFICYLGEKIK